MHLSPFVTANGDAVFVAGAGHSYKQATYRGFNVSLEWVGEGRKTQSCMCIWPESNVFVPGSTPGIWCIGRRAITEFVGFNKDDKCTGMPSVYCFREAREALPILGKDKNDQQALNALCDLVIKFAPDLVAMPVAPRAVRKDLNGEKVWEVTATNKNTGKVLSESEV